MRNFLAIILIIGGLLIAGVAEAHRFSNSDHNIDTEDRGDQYAWNDIIGWIDFDNDSVVASSTMQGWADSAIGPIVFNCANTPPNGDNVCGASNFDVNIDGSGNLSGYAWNDIVGWISFNGSNPNYQVSISSYPADSEESPQGFFDGYAWNDIIGWISFRCEDGFSEQSNNFISCGDIDYRVQMSNYQPPIDGFLESNIFDTGSDDVYYNYIEWRGVLAVATGSKVYLEIAFSDVINPGFWKFKELGEVSPNTRESLGSNGYKKRFFKYKVGIKGAPLESPIVNDVIINYSP